MHTIKASDAIKAHDSAAGELDRLHAALAPALAAERDARQGLTAVLLVHPVITTSDGRAHYLDPTTGDPALTVPVAEDAEVQVPDPGDPVGPKGP